MIPDEVAQLADTLEELDSTIRRETAVRRAWQIYESLKKKGYVLSYTGE